MSLRASRASRRAFTLLAQLLLVGAGTAGAQAAPPRELPASSESPRAAGKARFADARLATGIRMHYAEQGTGSGDPVILLHGYTDSWYSWSLVMPQLAASHRVYALDQRGHGKSTRARDGYGLSSLALDVLEFMDAKGIRRATIVGHSLGGMVAQRIAKFAPERVSGLVLVATTSTARYDHLREFVGAIRQLPDDVPYEFARDFQNGTVHAPVPPAFMQAMIAGSQRMPGRVWKALADGFIEEAAIEPLAAVPFPVLIVTGEKDEIFPRAEVAALQRIFPGAGHRDFAATGHSPHWERPEEFVRVLDGFLAGVRPTTR